MGGRGDNPVPVQSFCSSVGATLVEYVVVVLLVSIIGLVATSRPLTQGIKKQFCAAYAWVDGDPIRVQQVYDQYGHPYVPATTPGERDRCYSRISQLGVPGFENF